MKALTLNELRQMVGQPVWCPKENAYGIITCDKYGKWAGIPFCTEYVNTKNRQLNLITILLVES